MSRTMTQVIDGGAKSFKLMCILNLYIMKSSLNIVLDLAYIHKQGIKLMVHAVLKSIKPFTILDNPILLGPFAIVVMKFELPIHG